MRLFSESTRPPEYEVGKSYKVPCVRALWNVNGRHDETRPRWVPVHGTIHDDADHLEFPYLHLHVDGRFLPKRYCGIEGHLPPPPHLQRPVLLDCVIPEPGTTLLLGGIRMGNLDRSRSCRDALLELKDHPIESWFQFRSRKCRREYTGWGDAGIRMRDKLCAFKGSRLCLEKKICPHKGYDMSHVEEKDGVLECPLHGLQFDARTGRAVS